MKFSYYFSVKLQKLRRINIGSSFIHDKDTILSKNGPS